MAGTRGVEIGYDRRLLMFQRSRGRMRRSDLGTQCAGLDMVAQPGPADSGHEHGAPNDLPRKVVGAPCAPGFDSERPLGPAERFPRFGALAIALQKRSDRRLTRNRPTNARPDSRTTAGTIIGE